MGIKEGARLSGELVIDRWWTHGDKLIQQQVDRLAIDAEACNPFQLALPSTEAVIRMVTPSV